MARFLSAFVTLFAIIDALGNIPVFLSLTPHLSKDERRKTAFKASLYTCILLIFFSVAGNAIFTIFGITLPAFRVAGGLILLRIAFDMLEVREQRTRSTTEETTAARAKQDVSLVPLTVPMLAGPGSLSAVLVLSQLHPQLSDILILWTVIIINGLFIYFVFAGADSLLGAFKETGMRLIARIMGLILAAMAVQFILSGTREFIYG